MKAKTAIVLVTFCTAVFDASRQAQAYPTYSFKAEDDVDGGTYEREDDALTRRDGVVFSVPQMPDPFGLAPGPFMSSMGSSDDGASMAGAPLSRFLGAKSASPTSDNDGDDAAIRQSIRDGIRLGLQHGLKEALGHDSTIGAESVRQLSLVTDDDVHQIETCLGAPILKRLVLCIKQDAAKGDTDSSSDVVQGLHECVPQDFFAHIQACVERQELIRVQENLRTLEALYTEEQLAHARERQQGGAQPSGVASASSPHQHVVSSIFEDGIPDRTQGGANKGAGPIAASTSVATAMASNSTDEPTPSSIAGVPDTTIQAYSNASLTNGGVPSASAAAVPSSDMAPTSNNVTDTTSLPPSMLPDNSTAPATDANFAASNATDSTNFGSPASSTTSSLDQSNAANVSAPLGDMSQNATQDISGLGAFGGNATVSGDNATAPIAAAEDGWQGTMPVPSDDAVIANATVAPDNSTLSFPTSAPSGINASTTDGNSTSLPATDGLSGAGTGLNATNANGTMLSPPDGMIGDAGASLNATDAMSGGALNATDAGLGATNAVNATTPSPIGPAGSPQVEIPAMPLTKRDMSFARRRSDVWLRADQQKARGRIFNVIGADDLRKNMHLQAHRLNNDVLGRREHQRRTARSS